MEAYESFGVFEGVWDVLAQFGGSFFDIKESNFVFIPSIWKGASERGGDVKVVLAIFNLKSAFGKILFRRHLQQTHNLIFSFSNKTSVHANDLCVSSFNTRNALHQMMNITDPKGGSADPIIAGLACLSTSLKELI